MQRIELGPTENALITCFDHCATCMTRIFENGSLPKRWSGLKRIFIITLNFIILIFAFTSDWLFFACWPDLDRLIDQRNQSFPISAYKKDKQNFELIKLAYLLCLIAISISMITFQCVVYLFAVWRKTWRQSLVLVLEMLILLIQASGPPILVCLLFLITPIGVSDHRPNSIGLRGACEWQIFALTGSHLILLIGECLKLIFLGLCCCCCFTCCLGAWPIYKTSKWACMEENEEKLKRRSCCRDPTFGATVLDYMPPESDRGSWLDGIKWCIITCWTFPVILAGFASCILLIFTVLWNENFVYYKTWKF